MKNFHEIQIDHEDKRFVVMGFIWISAVVIIAAIIFESHAWFTCFVFLGKIYSNKFTKPLKFSILFSLAAKYFIAHIFECLKNFVCIQTIYCAKESFSFRWIYLERCIRLKNIFYYFMQYSNKNSLTLFWSNYNCIALSLEYQQF